MKFPTSRRTFLQTTTLATVGGVLSPRSLFARLASSAGPGEEVLVALFLRGGADGLSLCAPYGDPEYYRIRPNIALPPPGQAGKDSLINLDGYFGLHPSLAALEPYYRDGSFTIVHAVGSYELGRSHFDAQEFVETGTPGVKGSSGWLSRSIARIPGEDITEAASFSKLLPRIFLGPEPVLVAQELTRFRFDAPGWQAEAEELLSDIYAQDPSPVGRVGRDSLKVMKTFQQVPEIGAPPAHGAVYPDVAVGNGLRQAAQLIKAGLGTRCIFVSVDGDFDTHSKQLALNGRDYSQLGDSLGAFATDLGPLLDRVVVLVMTEFGRAVYESGGQGTDHGSGGAMLVLGGPVNGGRVAGIWPGIAREQLYLERDLAVTTDFRDVFAEIAEHHLKIPDVATLFPGYTPSTRPGVLRSQ